MVPRRGCSRSSSPYSRFRPPGSTWTEAGQMISQMFDNPALVQTAMVFPSPHHDRVNWVSFTALAKIQRFAEVICLQKGPNSHQFPYPQLLLQHPHLYSPSLRVSDTLLSCLTSRRLTLAQMHPSQCPPGQ